MEEAASIWFEAGVSSNGRPVFQRLVNGRIRIEHRDGRALLLTIREDGTVIVSAERFRFDVDHFEDDHGCYSYRVGVLQAVGPKEKK